MKKHITQIIFTNTLKTIWHMYELPSYITPNSKARRSVFIRPLTKGSRRVVSTVLLLSIFSNYFLTIMPRDTMAQVVGEDNQSTQSATLENLEKSLDSLSQPSNTVTEEIEKTQTTSNSSKNEIIPLSVDSDVKDESAVRYTPPVFKRLTKRNYRTNENIKIEIANAKGVEIRVKITDSRGTEISPFINEEINNRSKLLTIAPPTHIVPGKYKIEVSDTKGEISTQDFTWGVLAINPNKSIYSSEEKASFSIAVLNFSGEMVCDAKLTLQIEKPDGTTDTLSSDKGTINVTPTCRSKEVTLVPDYDASYKVGEDGTYKLILAAETEDGIYSITDSIKVDTKALFDIERKAATRIYPVNRYPVLMEITARQDFEGVITEEVPESFEITPAKEGEKYDDVVSSTQRTILSEEVLGASVDLAMPFKGDFEATSGFGENLEDPMLQEKYEEFQLDGHDGIDFDMPVGTKVIAADEGVVALAEEFSDYGTNVVLEHSWGKTYYGHLSEFKVKVGQNVKRGDLIALSGKTGLTSGPHLHFGIKPKNFNSTNGYFGKVDPAPFLGLSATDKKVLGISTKDEKIKVISWNVKLKKGESVELGYAYNAPLESPQFYTTGPAKLLDIDKKIVFSENRRWQIASDALPVAGMKKGVFQKITTTGSQSVGGVGFKPKAIILYAAPQTTTDANIAEGLFGFGVASSDSTERSVSYWSDGSNSSDSGRKTSQQYVLMLQSADGTDEGTATLTTFDNDGFTINWVTSTANAYYIHYIAFDEEVVTQAKSGTKQIATSGASQSDSTIGFQPDFMLFFSANLTTNDTNTATSAFSLGFAQGASAEGGYGIVAEDAQATADTCGKQLTTAAIVLMLTTTGTTTNCDAASPVEDAVADLASFDTNGFTLNVTNLPSAAADVHYLALKGGSYSVGSFNKPVANGGVTNIATSFTPEGVFLTGRNKASSSSVTVSADLSIGAATASSSGAMGSISSADTDADGNPDPDTRNSNTTAYTAIETATPTLTGSATLHSMHTTGLRLNWPTADATADQILYFAFGGPGYKYPKLTQDGYTFENDDEDQAMYDAVDENTVQAGTSFTSGKTLTSVKKGERLNLRMQIKNTGTGALNDNLALFYDRNDGIFSKVESVATASAFIGSLGNCADTNWNCNTITSTGVSNSIAIDQSGRAWVSYYEGASGLCDNSPSTECSLYAAVYVGSGGNGCLTDAWTCMTIDNSTTTGDVGTSSSIAFDRSGKPWISYYDQNNSALKVASYSPGTAAVAPCSANWLCETVDNGGTYGAHGSIAFDNFNVPWVTYWDASANDIRVAARGSNFGTVCTDADWSCSAIDNTGVNSTSSSINFSPSGNAWVSYYYETNSDLIVAQYVGSGGSGCLSTAWTCEIVDTNVNWPQGSTNSIAFDSNGIPWVSYYDLANTALKVATRGNTLWNPTGTCTDTDWECDTVDNSDSVGNYNAIAFDVAGVPWVSYYQAVTGSCDNSPTNECSLRVARFVGSAGNCTSTAWSCGAVDDPTSTGHVGETSKMAFAPNGNAWVSYNPSSGGFKVANIHRGSEILTSSGLAGATGDPHRESHADMNTYDDTSDQNDADCLTATTWNNGLWLESEEASGSALTRVLPAGSGTSQCSEISWTLDTSYAVAGTTYRFVVASKDSFREDKGAWRGPISVASNAYPTLTIESDTTTRYSKDNLPKFTDCTSFDQGSGGSSSYGCLNLFDGDDATGNDGTYISQALDSSGTPWITFVDYESSAGDLVVAKYVGSGGNCTNFDQSAGSALWQCTRVTDGDILGDATYAEIGFDHRDTPWVVFKNGESSTGDVAIATFVGSGGNCDGFDGAGGSDEWQCTTIFDGLDNDAFEISMAFDKSGNPWVAFADLESSNYNLVVANFVGTGGNCDGFDGAGGSDEWQCTTIVDADSTGDATGNDIIFDNNNVPWIAFKESESSTGNLATAKYVGSGGNCDGFDEAGGSDAWQCTRITDGDAAQDGNHASIAFDSSNDPWIAFRDSETQANLVVAEYVGSGGDCASFDTGGGGAGSTAWECTQITDGDSTSDAGYNSIKFDLSGTPWIAFTDVETEGNIAIAKYVGSGGNCSTFDEAGGSASWRCTKITDGDDADDATYINLDFDLSGVAWMTFRNDETEGNVAALRLNLPHYSNDLRYQLDTGKAPATESGSCTSTTDNKGYCGVATDDSDYDSIASLNERPIYNFATRVDSNLEYLTSTWKGRTNIAPSTGGTTGDLVMEVYNFSDETWETLDSETASSDCSSSDCTLSGTPSSGPSQMFFESDGANYWQLTRVWQYENSSTQTLKTGYYISEVDGGEEAETPTLSQLMRHGKWFNASGVRQPFTF